MRIAGHIVGAVAIILYFISYQVSDKKKLLIIQSIATGLNCIQFLLLGAYSGFALNIVCIIRNILFYYKDGGKRLLLGKWLPYAMSLVIAFISAFSWDGYHSLFIIGGLMINTVCMGICDAQNLRKSTLLTCPMVIVYSAFEGSYTAIISESVSICSAIIGIIRYMKTKKTAD